MRRFYLKNGFADVRIVVGGRRIRPGQKGFVVTFTIDEGAQYHFGKVEMMSNVARDRSGVAARLVSGLSAGDVYNAEAGRKIGRE